MNRRPSPEFEQYWTILEAADRLRSHENSVRRWIYQGRLKTTKAGRKRLVLESEIQLFLKRSENAAQ